MAAMTPASSTNGTAILVVKGGAPLLCSDLTDDALCSDFDQPCADNGLSAMADATGTMVAA